MPSQTSTVSVVSMPFRGARWPTRLRAFLFCALAISTACGEATEQAAPIVSDTILLYRVAELQDHTVSLIGAPIWVGETPDGSFYVVDESDRNVKFYDAAGRRTNTVGRSGGGPGEFSSLMSAEYLNDSLMVYDFVRGTATIFSPSGSPSRTLRFSSPSPFRVRVVSDTLLLAIAHPARSDKLLRVLRRDGSVISSFFPKPKDFKDNPLAALHSIVWADGYGDRIYAGLFGGDEIFAYSVAGKLIATLNVGVPTLTAIAAANAGKLQRADGSWLQHDMPAIMGIVALADDQVAYQIAPYDTKVGTDLVAGGQIVFASLRGNGLFPIARDSLGAGLFGRDTHGRALALGYIRDIEGQYYLGRISPTPARQ